MLHLDDSQGGTTRRLLMLQRIPMLAGLAASALAGLAERAREITVRQGELDSGCPADSIRFYPDGVTWGLRLERPVGRGLSTFAPNLVPWLCGSDAEWDVYPELDGTAIEIEGSHLAAALQDEFALYLAVARATARELQSACSSGRWVPTGPTAQLQLTSGSTTIGLVDRLVSLRETLPLSDDHIGALVQLARQAVELRAGAGMELWREGDPAHTGLFLLNGSVRAKIGGREMFRLTPGSLLGGFDLLAQTPRWFTAVADGSLLALVVPVERFIDVLEDRSQLARDVLSALARSLMTSWSAH